MVESGSHNDTASMQARRNATNGAEMVSRGMARIREHLSGIATGIGEVTGGCVALCDQAIRWAAVRLSNAIAVALSQLSQRLSSMRTAIAEAIARSFARARHFAHEARAPIARFLTSPWTWIVAIAAPAAVWFVVRFFAIASDAERMALFLKQHPIISWSVIGTVLLIESIVLGVAAFNFIRGLYKAVKRASSSAARSLGRLYRLLPANLQIAVRWIPYLLMIGVVAIQLVVICVLLWLFASRIPARAWALIIPSGAMLALVSVLSWLGWRAFAPTLRRAAAASLRAIEGILGTFANWLAKKVIVARHYVRAFVATLCNASQHLRDRVNRAAGAVSSARFEIALVRHQGSKASGPKFGLSILQVSLVSVALVSIGLFSVATFDLSGLQIALFSAEATDGRSPREHDDEKGPTGAMSRSAEGAWDNTLGFFEGIAASLDEALSGAFKRTSITHIQTFNGMTPTSYSWAHGSAVQFRPLPDTPLERFGVGAVCRYDMVLAIGTASSDGARAVNQRLARVRGRELAGLLRQSINACRAAPLLVAISLGPSSALQPSATQRQLIALGVAHVGRHRARNFTADVLRSFLLDHPQFRDIARNYPLFEACTLTDESGRSAIEKCAPATPS